MQKTPMMLALAILLGAASGALATDKKQYKHKKHNPQNTQAVAKPAAAAHTAPQKEHTALTGSFIKRDVRRAGLITDGPNAVYVLDERSIRTSGASDLSQVLITRGFRR